MKSRQIGEILRKYRKQRGWSVADVAIQLRDNYELNVAEKTIYGWESDQSYPRTETLLLLCELYQIESFSSDLIIPASTNEFQITSEERRLIEKYRQHPEFRNAIKKLLL